MVQSLWNCAELSMRPKVDALIHGLRHFSSTRCCIGGFEIDWEFGTVPLPALARPGFTIHDCPFLAN